jgi:DNA-binding Lrp family transcriptional regulator
MQIAFVCIITEPASMEEVLKALKAVEGVEEAEMVYGTYDIIVKVKGDSIDSLKKIITGHIRTINNVRATITMMVVESEYLK